jgi:CheY-like chemotaxis protein
MPDRCKEDAVILAVGDDPGDAVMVREALEEALPAVRVYVASDGEQAIDFVRRPGAGERRPDLILLDLNLPRRGGVEVLADLKGDDDFSSIPIAVLTTSRDPHHEQRCYSLHANAYIIKPADLNGFASMIDEIVTWFAGLLTRPGSS